MGNNWTLLFLLAVFLIFLTHKFHFGSSFMLESRNAGRDEREEKALCLLSLFKVLQMPFKT